MYHISLRARSEVSGTLNVLVTHHLFNIVEGLFFPSDTTERPRKRHAGYQNSQFTAEQTSVLNQRPNYLLTYLPADPPSLPHALVLMLSSI